MTATPVGMTRFRVSFRHSFGRYFEGFSVVVDAYGPDDALHVAYAGQNIIDAHSIFDYTVVGHHESGRKYTGGIGRGDLVF